MYFAAFTTELSTGSPSCTSCYVIIACRHAEKTTRLNKQEYLEICNKNIRVYVILLSQYMTCCRYIYFAYLMRFQQFIPAPYLGKAVRSALLSLEWKIGLQSNNT